MMEAANCSLRVNRLLLDPKFESYKLSLDPLPCYGAPLDSGVAEVKLRDDQYTLDHMQAYSMYNYLHSNPWCPDSVYYVDQLGRVLHMAVTLDTALGTPVEVFRFPTEPSACDRRLCASMHFTSRSWVTLSDGTGTIYLIHTAEAEPPSSGKWELTFNEELGEPFIVLHSVLSGQEERPLLHALLLNIQKDELDAKGSGFHVCLEWISIALPSQDESKCEILTRRTLQGKSVPHYAAIEPDGKGLMIISYKPFQFITEEQNGAEEERMEMEEQTAPLYVWQQTTDDVTLTFAIPEGAAKGDIRIHFSPTQISISLKEQPPFLKGPLHSLIDHESSTWVLKDERSVEVTLMKRDAGSMWPEVIIGNKQGKFIADPALCAPISEQLRHLTSEELNPDPDVDKPPCNAQELEECDVSLEDCATLCRFDGNTLKASHVVNLGSNQFLFSMVATPEGMPCFALRHDVDALLWQPVSAQGDNLWEHAATFNALGYVQASKRDKKFFTCAPNFSYAALCECVRRIFIYRQPAPVSTVLYNRKEGRHVGQVAKQQVASLESSEPILGFQASDERLFVLTSKKLFVIRVNSD